METWTEILLNLTQIQDYTMTGTWLHRFDGGMLQQDPSSAWTRRREDPVEVEAEAEAEAEA
jgi:hypothetical protein